NRNVLTRMVGRSSCRVVAVVGGDKQQIFLAKGTPERRKRRVEFPQRSKKARYVVPVAVKLVEIYKVGEEKPGIRRTSEPLLDQTNSFGVSRRVPGLDRPAGEKVVDLAHPAPRDPSGSKRIEERLRRRQDREIPPVGCPAEGTRLAHERPRDDPRHIVGLYQQRSRYFAPGVQLGKWHDRLVRCNLEDRIGGGIHDPRASA